MTDAGRVLAGEIAREGPMSFRRFMEVALYHPEHGYYRRDRDPFGVAGDFYTAAQLQPVFGRLTASAVKELLKSAEGEMVVELGAGRREMEDAFSGFRYVPVDFAYGELPERIAGVVFSNEFFDALPVEVWDEAGELRVTFDGEDFRWDRPASGSIREFRAEDARWVQRIARSVKSGYVLTIDYGFTAREAIRFPQGTLMSYRRHHAIEDVLAHPGEQDITAHVDFTLLREEGERAGLETVRFESLAQMLVRAGEADEFASALQGSSAEEEHRHRMQLKTLLFGMGETFRVLLQRKR